MESEKPVPVPLTGEEVRNWILAKVEESLLKSCHLKFDNAYTSFKGKIEIRLILSDYGREVTDNHAVHLSEVPHMSIQEIEELLATHPEIMEATVQIEPAPPNQVRIESGQAVPVKTVVDGKTVIRNVKYSPRKAKP